MVLVAGKGHETTQLIAGVAHPYSDADEVRAALAEAEAQGIAAKAVTPFLLARIHDLTKGRSLEANIALVRNNARLAAEIAQEINTLT